MFESIEAYRQREVSELNELIRAGVESDASISENYSGIIARLRTLRHFSRDLPGLVEHVAGIANRNAVADWANAGGGARIGDLPWSKVADSCAEILAEPPLYERDWTTGSVEIHFSDAIDTWMDIGTVVSDFYFDNEDQVDGAKLIYGATVIFRVGAEAKFEAGGWPQGDRLVDITNALMGRDDFELDMLPRSLTYFGDVGLATIAALGDQDAELRTALENSARDGYFTPEAR